MNFLQIIAIFFSEKKQAYSLNENNSSASVYNLKFIKQYKKHNKINDNISTQDLLLVYELTLWLGIFEIILGLTYSYFIHMFSHEVYIFTIASLSVAIIVSYLSAKINLFKNKHKEISSEYISLMQKKMLCNVIDMNLNEKIAEKSKINRL